MSRHRGYTLLPLRIRGFSLWRYGAVGFSASSVVHSYKERLYVRAKRHGFTLKLLRVSFGIYIDHTREVLNLDEPVTELALAVPSQEKP